MDLGNVARSSADPEWIGQPLHEPLRPRTRPAIPAKDAFYQPPAGYEHARPGTILRSRDVELAFLGFIPQKFHATQLLYRTTDLNGEPQATVTTIAPTPLSLPASASA